MSFLTPLLLGTYNAGMNLGRNLQVTQLSRNAGHMYARWVDFSLVESQNLVVRLAEGLKMTRTGGDATVILSQVTVPTSADCTANNIPAGQCVNKDIPVIIHRIQFGNTAIKQSVFGSPSPAITQVNGAIPASEYLTQPSVRATNWGSIMTLAASEVAYVSEVYARSPDWNIGTNTGAKGVYARSIF